MELKELKKQIGAAGLKANDPNNDVVVPLCGWFSCGSGCYASCYNGCSKSCVNNDTNK